MGQQQTKECINGYKHWGSSNCHIISIWVAIYEVDKTRRLQKKAIAIKLLDDGRHGSKWCDAQRFIFDMITENDEFDWKDFAKRKFTLGEVLENEEREISDAVRIVLNNYEFISVAVPYATKLSAIHGGHARRQARPGSCLMKSCNFLSLAVNTTVAENYFLFL